MEAMPQLGRCAAQRLGCPAAGARACQLTLTVTITVLASLVLTLLLTLNPNPSPNSNPNQVNASWPHAQHRIVNTAADATSLGAQLSCLFSHVGSHPLDLVVAEF